MVRIKDDSGTHTKCLLDPFDEEASQLPSAEGEEAEHVTEHHYQVARMTDNEAHEYI